MEREEPPPNELVFLQGGCLAYTASKNFTPGQYVIPFSFKLPENIPGSFHIKTAGKDGKEYPLRISYTVEMFIDTDKIDDPDHSLRACFTREHEFEIREFLFTDEEVEEDVKQQQLENKVKTLFKTQTVLKPMFTGSEADKAQMDKLKQADDQVFYDQLLAYFQERGQPISNSVWNTGHTF